MNTRHTPGPWHLISYPNSDKQFEIYCPADFPHTHIATVNNVHADKLKWKDAEVALANARLIRSAPELLKHLERIVAAIDRMPGNNPLDGLADEARAAIARATGQATEGGQ